MKVLMKRKRCILGLPLSRVTYLIAKDWGDIYLLIVDSKKKKIIERYKINEIRNISFSSTKIDELVNVGTIYIDINEKNNQTITISKIHDYKAFGLRLDECFSR
jgi:hypothetical protein